MHETDLKNALSSLELKTINAGEIVAGELVTFYSANDIAVLVEGRRLFNIEIDDIDIDKEIVKWFSFTNEDFKTGRDIDIFNSVCKIFNYHGSLEAFLEEYGYEYLIETLPVQFTGTEEEATMPVVEFVPIEDEESSDDDNDPSDDDDDLPDDE
jgi:hypothetical protein